MEALVVHLRNIYERLGFLPSREFLKQVPAWRGLIEKLEANGSFTSAHEELASSDLFSERTVSIPSAHQARVGAIIARDRKKAEVSRPGTRKTIAALAGLDAIIRKCEGEGMTGAVYNTLISCPGYVIPTWTREIERFFKEPNVVVVTRKNRRSALERASLPENKFIIVSHSMTYQNAHDVTSSAGDFFNANSEFRGEKAMVVNALEAMVGEKRAKRYARKFNYPDLVLKYLQVRDISESSRVLQAIRDCAFNPENSERQLVRYTVIDEFHNIVNPHSLTGSLLAEVFRESEYGILMSGTGIANEFANLRYAAYLLNIIEEPHHFNRLVGNDPKKVKAVFDLMAVRPTLRLLDVQPDIKPPIRRIITYSMSQDEWNLYLGILNSAAFETPHMQRLLTYCMGNPQLTLPENQSGDVTNPDSEITRATSFFSRNPNMRETAERLTGSKISKLCLVKGLVAEAKKQGRKCLIGCEFTSDTTSMLERELSEYGAVKIDQSVSAEPGEIRLTDEEVEKLQELQGSESGRLYTGSELVRSDLTCAARQALGIPHMEIFEMSERERVIMDFVTNPDLTVCIAGYKSLREGIDCQEATVIIPYDITTMPSWFLQFRGRAWRSGQKDQVEVWVPVVPNTIDEGRYRRLCTKLRRNEKAEFGEDMTFDELEEWRRGDSPAFDPEIAPLLALQRREFVRNLFNAMNGEGSNRWVDWMLKEGSAMAFAQHYNFDYETTFGANANQGIAELMECINRRRSERFESILDLGGGPNALVRAIERPATTVDIVKYQHDFGIAACERAGISGFRNILASASDLTRCLEVKVRKSQGELIDNPNKNLPVVFDSRETHEGEFSLPSNEYDFIAATLIADLLSPEERARMVSEMVRVARKPDSVNPENNAYVVIAESVSKFDDSCRERFYEDLHRHGIRVDKSLTGTYTAKNIISLTGSASNFEVFYIVGRVDGVLDETQQGEFLMKEEYSVIEPGEEDIEGRENRRERERRRIRCENFYNSDNGVSLDEFQSFESYEPPVRETGAGVESVLIEKFDELSEGELDSALDYLSNMFGEGQDV